MQDTATRPAPPPINARGGSASEYRELPEATFRFVIGEPKIRQMYSDKYGKWSTMVDLPLTLTEEEKKRLEEEFGKPPEGTFQSWRPAFGGYSCGYTLNSNNAGKESALVTFMACAFGAKNAGDFRKWINAGGCPTVTARDNDGRIEQINSWLKWLEGLEVYGTIRHDAGNNGQTLARFGGPMAVGSLPGQPEPAYQNTQKGKLRAMMSDEPAPADPATVEDAVAQGAAVAAQYNEAPAVNSVKGCAEHGAPQAGCTDCFDALMGEQASA